MSERAGDAFTMTRYRVAVRHCGLPPATRLVALTLAGYPAANCRPSVPTLQRDTGLQRTAVFEALAELERASLLVREGFGKARVFRLTIPENLSFRVGETLGNRPLGRTVEAGEPSGGADGSGPEPSAGSPEPSAGADSNRPLGRTQELQEQELSARARDDTAAQLRWITHHLAKCREPDCPHRSPTGLPQEEASA